VRNANQEIHDLAIAGRAPQINPSGFAERLAPRRCNERYPAAGLPPQIWPSSDVVGVQHLDKTAAVPRDLARELNTNDQLAPRLPRPGKCCTSNKACSWPAKGSSTSVWRDGAVTHWRQFLADASPPSRVHSTAVRP